MFCVFSISDTTCFNSSIRIGFERYPSMPAPRHFSLSPFIACAVIATIGTCFPVPASAARMAVVASSPSISGICDVHKYEVEFFRLRPSQRLPTIVDDLYLVAKFLQDPHRQRLVHRVILREQNSQGALRSLDGS